MYINPYFSPTGFLSHSGTAFGSDPGNMRQYGLACINLRAKYRKLKGWQKNRKSKK